MAQNIIDEIAAETAGLPPEQQRKVLELAKSLGEQQVKDAPRRRSVLGDLEHSGVRVTEQDIEEARREMWGG